MNQTTDWNFIFVFVVGIIGVLVSIVLFFENKSISSRFLAAFLFTISIVSINYGLTTTTFFLNYPFLWRSAGWVAFCAPAFSFLYVRSILFPHKKFDKYCLLLFLPALIYSIILIPLYTTPSADKLEFIKKTLVDKTLISLEPDVILPQGWGTLARLYYGILITITELYLLYKWSDRNYIDKYIQHKSVYVWVFLFATITSILCILLVIEYFFHLSKYIDLTHQILYSLSGIILFVSLYLLFKPSLLYGLNPSVQGMKNGERVIKEKKTTPFSLEQRASFKQKIDFHFVQNAPFIKEGYSINDLSTELNIPVYLLSTFINEEYKVNFNEWINDFRIDYLSNLLKTSPKHLKFTLESLGNQVGFSSRSAFNSALKKKTGKTPSEFFDIKKYN